jgi:hypothetical protein
MLPPDKQVLSRYFVADDVDTWPEQREGLDAFPCLLRCCRRIYAVDASVSECLEDEKRRLYHDEDCGNYPASESAIVRYVQSVIADLMSAALEDRYKDTLFA